MLFKSCRQVTQVNVRKVHNYTNRNQQQGDPTLRCCEKYVSLSDILLSSSFFDPDTDLICSNKGALLVLIKSLINYLVDQKFSGPLLLHQASMAAKPLELNTHTHIHANTSRSKQRQVHWSHRCVHALTHTERRTDFDEAKLDYKGGGGWLVCSL